jgi:ketosteroid isomerase-like protein
MEMQGDSGYRSAFENIRQATNRHDLDALTACFTPDYQSEFPAHPDRSFHGHEQLRKNWVHIFGAVPNIQVALLRSAVGMDGDPCEW